MSASAIPEIVKKNVRAVLLSKIGGVLAVQFLKDYRSLVQQRLNFVEYGFKDIEEFIKAIPEYARFEYSQKEMAYKIFGVGDPNTYMSMAAKKAQGMPGPSSYTDSKRIGMQETDDAKKMFPNDRGLYTMCFKIELVDSTNKEYLMSKFSDVGEVGEVNVTPRWVFIRYKTKNGALAALQKYSSDYDMHVADEKPRATGNTTKPLPSIQNKASKNPSKGKNRSNGRRDDHKKSKKTIGKNRPHRRNETSNTSERKRGSDHSPEIQVYVGNISNSKTEEEFKAIFKDYRHVECRVIHKEEKVFAFVTVESIADAQVLIDRLHQVNFGGRLLQVRLSDSQRQVRPNEDQGSSCHIPKESRISEVPSWKCLLSGSNATTDKVYDQNDSSSICSAQCSSESDLSFSNLNIRVSADGDKIITSSPVYSRMSLQTCTEANKIPRLVDSLPDLVDLKEDMPELEDIEDEDTESEEDEDNINPVSIFVGNFPPGTTEKELTSLFWVYGALEINMVNDGIYSHKCTKAYVWLPNAEKARAAIADLNQQNYYGYILLVDVPYNDEALRRKIQNKHSDSDLLSDKYSISSSVSVFEEVEGFGIDTKIESFSHFIDKLKAWKNGLESGMKIQVYVSMVESDRMFWGQNISEKSETKELHELTVQLQKPAAHLCNSKRLGRCAAKFEGEWYRAWVMRVFADQNKVHVFFIDYGNTSIVDYADSQVIPAKFWNLAPRCRPFKIIGPCPKNLRNLESEVISCQVISSASSSEGFLTEVKLCDNCT